MVYVHISERSNQRDPGRANEFFEATCRQFLQSTSDIRGVHTEGFCQWGLDDLSLPPWRGQGAFLALGALNFASDFVRSYVRNCPAGGCLSTEDRERSFFRDSNTEDRSSFGTFVSKAGTEYEFASNIYEPKFTEANLSLSLVFLGR